MLIIKGIKCLRLLIAIFCLCHINVMFAQKSLPSVNVEGLDGETINIKSLHNDKPIIISFWGITCKPCLLELNSLNDQMDEWLEEVDFDIIAVSIDDSRFSSRAKAMAKGYGWRFTTVFDKNQELKRAMNVSFTPHTLIFDAEGNMVYSHTGYTPGSEIELLDKLREISKR